MRPRRTVIVLSAAALVATTASAVPPAVATSDPAATTITLFLKAPHPAALARLAAAHGLSRTARLAALRPLLPSDATHNAIAASLRLQGFRVVDQTVWSVTATGAAATSARLFGRTDVPAGASRLARARAQTSALPRVPAGLSQLVSAAFPTNGSVPIYHHSTGVLDGSGFRNAYGPAHTTPSTGKNDGLDTVATIQLANFYGLVPGQFSNSQQATDLSQYATNHGLADPVANHKYFAEKVAGGPSACDDGFQSAAQVCYPGGDIEVALDQESILSTAPSAHQQAYFAPNDSTAHFNLAFESVLDDVLGEHAKHKNPHIVALSSSWGQCESQTGAAAIRTLEPTLQSLTAAGVTVFASSGDAGIYDCGDSTSTQPDVDYPGSSPSVISVGGTHLSAPKNAANTGTNWTDSAWTCRNASDCLTGNGGTGGGRSGEAYAPGNNAFKGFAAPIWQRAAITTAPFRNNTKRLVPDIAADGAPASGFRIYTGDRANCQCTDGNAVIGGTSLSSPMSAALLTNALAGAGHTTGAGDIHGALYSAYHASRSLRNTNPAKAVRDVTAGQNGSPNDRHSDPSVFARPGFDTVSGVGAVLWPAVIPYIYDKHAPVVRAAHVRVPNPFGGRWRSVVASWRAAQGADPRLLGPTHVTIRRLGASRALVSNYLYPPSGRRGFTGVPGSTYQLIVAARDLGRHQSAPTTTSVQVPLDDLRFTHGSSWHRVSRSGDIAGSHLNAFARGAAAQASGFGRTYSMRAHVGPGAGVLGVSYRGHRVATLNLAAARSGVRSFRFYSSSTRAGRTFTFTDLTNKWVSLDALWITF
jgi:hypothetical protein